MDKYNIIRFVNFLIVGPLIVIQSIMSISNIRIEILNMLVLFLGIYIILNNLFFFIKNFYIIYDEKHVNTIVV